MNQRNGEYFPFFNNYAAIAANMPNREFHAPNIVSERSKTLVLAKSFRLKSKTFR